MVNGQTANAAFDFSQSLSQSVSSKKSGCHLAPRNIFYFELYFALSFNLAFNQFLFIKHCRNCLWSIPRIRFNIHLIFGTKWLRCLALNNICSTHLFQYSVQISNGQFRCSSYLEKPRFVRGIFVLNDLVVVPNFFSLSSDIFLHFDEWICMWFVTAHNVFKIALFESSIFDSGYFRCVMAKLRNLYSCLGKDDKINYKSNRLRCALNNMLSGFRSDVAESNCRFALIWISSSMSSDTGSLNSS